MRPSRSFWVLLALLLANAGAILFFRFFITVDGPIHVLHGSLLEAPWSTAQHMAQAIRYDRDQIYGSVGTRVLMVLLVWLSPLQAHVVFAALVCCAMVVSAIAYLRAHGTRMHPAILWLVPVTFNLLLVIGLFHFLLGIAVAFGSVAWWKWFEGSPRVRWSGLFIGAVIAWYTHRGSPVLLGILLLLALVVGPHIPRSTSETVDRTSRIRRIVMIVVLVAAGVVVVLRVVPLLRTITEGIPAKLPTFNLTDLLRPLFLLDRTTGGWPIHGIGLLLAISLVAGIVARWRMCFIPQAGGRRPYWHDALLVLICGLVLLSWIYGTPVGRKVFIAERCQWLALLSLAIWLAAIADAERGWFARVIGIAAVCALPLHIIRLVWAERTLAERQEAYDRTMEACAALDPGSLVVPVIIDPDPLMQHMEAYVAMGHSGILVAPDEHVMVVVPPHLAHHAHWLRTEDGGWLLRHWRRGIPPEVDQVLILGKGIGQAMERLPWPNLLGPRFRSTYENGYARIYTAQRDTLP